MFWAEKKERLLHAGESMLLKCPLVFVLEIENLSFARKIRHATKNKGTD